MAKMVHRSERPSQLRARCQSSPQVSFRPTHSLLEPSMHPQYPGEFEIHWKKGERDEQSVKKKENKWEKVGAQIGQLGCAGKLGRDVANVGKRIQKTTKEIQ